MSFNLDLRVVASATLLVTLGVTATAQAAATTDSHGNVGYATAQECDLAVLSGAARFYKPVLRHSPKLRKGEASVSRMTLQDVDKTYANGACDQGAGTSMSREGVSKVLQGRWIPFAPTMLVNAYKAKDGKIQRVSMHECDNNFSGAFPRAVPAPALVAAVPMAAPQPAPVVVPTVVPAAPMVVTPVLAAVTAFPYVFGTVGAQRDLMGNDAIAGIAQHDDHDSKLAAQGGVGYQFDPEWGVETFVQAGRRHDFENGAAYKARAMGVRATAGSAISDSTRLFAKLGVARVQHSGDALGATQTRPTMGLGILHSLGQNLALRADFDHYLRKSSDTGRDWKALNYFGIGLQYAFKP